MLLSLAAATVLDAPQEEVIDVAAQAGFDAVGLRFTERPSDRRLGGLADRVASVGLSVLDVEVVRLLPETSATDYFWLLDTAAALSARYVLTVSQDGDVARTAYEMGVLADRIVGSGVRIGFEFMRFTSFRTLADACALAEATRRENVAVLADVLHLVRSGGAPADLRQPWAGRVGYVQICDGPAAGPESDEQLAFEARHHRLMPGAGQLPVVEALDAVGDAIGDVPISVEVQSDKLAATMTPLQRAQLAMQSARDVLSRTRLHRSHVHGTHLRGTER